MRPNRGKIAAAAGAATVGDRRSAGSILQEVNGPAAAFPRNAATGHVHILANNHGCEKNAPAKRNGIAIATRHASRSSGTSGIGVTISSGGRAAEVGWSVGHHLHSRPRTSSWHHRRLIDKPPTRIQGQDIFARHVHIRRYFSAIREISRRNGIVTRTGP